MVKLTESAIEDFAIEHLQTLGFAYVLGAVVRKFQTTRFFHSSRRN
jgi:hypothetical protein